MRLSCCIPEGRQPLGIPVIIFDISNQGGLHRRKAEYITIPEPFSETGLAATRGCGSG